jgi:surface carbohydrate biosynthesis protein (TIGR04326 family)
MPESDIAKSDKIVESLLIWDVATPHPAADDTTVLWRGFAADAAADVVSIPQLIEENAEVFRARYLAWVYELGELHLQGRRLIDHLELRPGFSYWWMTLLTEKCNYSKSPQIDDAIRMLAFTDWVTGRPLARITLVSANPPLAECLRGWCKKNGVAFEWQHISTQGQPKSWVRRAYGALPTAIQAWVWLLKYLFEHWPLRGVGLKASRQATESVFFVSYLFNLVPEAVKEGRYESRYWGTLPELLLREGCKSIWLHLYVKDGLLPDARKAARTIQSFNKVGRGMEAHVTLDTFLGLRVVFQSIKDWFRLAGMNRMLDVTTQPRTSEALNLWPLFINDWQQSMRGQTAMANVLLHNLFETSMNSLTKQRLGVYLQENQGWELAFIHSWKAAGHGQLVGCPHSTVRFWDLRYFFDQRSYLRSNKNPLPMPDRVAVNGKAAKDAFMAGDYPAGGLVEVEALRYLHLNTTTSRVPQSTVKNRQALRLLVLGDYLPSNTRLQMDLLHRVAKSLPAGTVVIVKPHPACPIKAQDYPELSLKVVTEPIAQLLAECDVAFTSAATSAAVDAYCAGVNVISVLDPTTLNMNPLRGYTGVRFISTTAELIDSLILSTSTNKNHTKSDPIFIVDKKLKRWAMILFKKLL